MTSLLKSNQCRHAQVQVQPVTCAGTRAATHHGRSRDVVITRQTPVSSGLIEMVHAERLVPHCIVVIRQGGLAN